LIGLHVLLQYGCNCIDVPGVRVPLIYDLHIYLPLILVPVCL
jgi:hypothetical protein